MKTIREIISNSMMASKERRSVVGALNPQPVDIYQQRVMTPHQMMEEVDRAYSTNPIFRSAIDTCGDFIYGGDVTYKNEDDMYEIQGNAYIKAIGLNDWALDVIRETVKSANGYVEADYNSITGLPQRFYPQADSSRWYINCDQHCEPLKTKKIVLENGEQVYKEVENLDEYYIQRINPGIKYYDAKWYNLSYYLDQQYRQFRIYGIPLHRDKIIHHKLNTGTTGVYGQSYLASAINDNLILQELEKSIAVLAKYKAVPRKIISYGDKDNPATGEELDDFIIYLESLQRDEDPIVNKPIKADDLSYAGGEINLDYMLTHIRKKLTSGVVPDFLTGFGADVNKATAQVELISYILSIYSKRRCFLRTWEKYIMGPWEEMNGIEAGELEFNELDFETKQEKTGRVMQLWTANLLPLNDCLKELGYPKTEEPQDKYYVEWQNELMSKGMQGMQPYDGMNGLGGGFPALPEPDVPDYDVSAPDELSGGEKPSMSPETDKMELPEGFSLDNTVGMIKPQIFKESSGGDIFITGMDNLVYHTAVNIRKHYKQKLMEVKKISGRKTLEILKEDLRANDIRELSILLKLGGEDIKKDFNKSIKQAFLKGIQDGGKQIGLVSGVPVEPQIWHNIQRNGWRYVKKNVDLGSTKVEGVLYKGLMGELAGKKLEQEVEKTYNFISWKSEQLAETELRKAYTAGIKHTMANSPYKVFKFHVHRDERTCPECMKNSERIFHTNDFKAPYPPLHPNCRCHTTIDK